MGAVTDPSGNAKEQHLDVALICALNTELPPGFRIPKPDEAPCNVVTTATKVMATATRVNKGYILMNEKLQREVDDLKKEREEMKEQTKETLDIALIRALNNELPASFRNPEPDRAPRNVVATAIRVIKKCSSIYKKQQRELNDHKKEREEIMRLMQKEQTEETLSMIRELEEYRFCVTELLMYITGVKLREEDVDFAILRQALGKCGRTGNGEGWTLKALGNEIILAFPGKKKITEEEKLA